MKNFNVKCVMMMSGGAGDPKLEKLEDMQEVSCNWLSYTVYLEMEIREELVSCFFCQRKRKSCNKFLFRKKLTNYLLYISVDDSFRYVFSLVHVCHMSLVAVSKDSRDH